MPIRPLPMKKMLSQNSSPQPEPFWKITQGVSSKSFLIASLLVCSFHTVAEETCTGCKCSTRGAGALYRINTFTSNTVVHFQNLQFAECLLCVSAEKTVAQAKNSGIGCMGTSDFSNGRIGEAVLISWRTDHRNSVTPNLVVRFAESIICSRNPVGKQEVHEHEASGSHGAGAAGRLIAVRSQMVKGKTSGVPPPLTLCALPAEK